METFFGASIEFIVAGSPSACASVYGLAPVGFLVVSMITWGNVFLTSIRFGDGAVFSDVFDDQSSLDDIVGSAITFFSDCFVQPSGSNVMPLACLGVGFLQVFFPSWVGWFGLSFFWFTVFVILIHKKKHWTVSFVRKSWTWSHLSFRGTPLVEIYHSMNFWLHLRLCAMWFLFCRWYFWKLVRAVEASLSQLCRNYDSIIYQETVPSDMVTISHVIPVVSVGTTQSITVSLLLKFKIGSCSHPPRWLRLWSWFPSASISFSVYNCILFRLCLRPANHCGHHLYQYHFLTGFELLCIMVVCSG